MLSFLCHWLVIGDGEIVNLICIILRTSQLIPLAGVHIIAHTHIHDARLKRTADGLLAIFRVTTAIEAITLDAEVGTSLVLYWVVELHGYVSAVSTQMHNLTIIQGFGSLLANLLVGGSLLSLRHGVDKLAWSWMQLHNFYILCLCRSHSHGKAQQCAH